MGGNRRTLLASTPAAWLIRQDEAGEKVGPEPAQDRFAAVALRRRAVGRTLNRFAHQEACVLQGRSRAPDLLLGQPEINPASELTAVDRKGAAESSWRAPEPAEEQRERHRLASVAAAGECHQEAIVDRAWQAVAAGSGLRSRVRDRPRDRGVRHRRPSRAAADPPAAPQGAPVHRQSSTVPRSRLPVDPKSESW